MLHFLGRTPRHGGRDTAEHQGERHVADADAHVRIAGRGGQAGHFDQVPVQGHVGRSGDEQAAAAATATSYGRLLPDLEPHAHWRRRRTGHERAAQLA